MITDLRNKYLLIRYIRYSYNIINDIFFRIISYAIILIKRQIIDIFCKELYDTYICFYEIPNKNGKLYNKIEAFIMMITKQSKAYQCCCLRCSSNLSYCKYIIEIKMDNSRYCLPYCSKHLNEIYDKMTIFDKFVNKYLTYKDLSHLSMPY